MRGIPLEAGEMGCSCPAGVALSPAEYMAHPNVSISGLTEDREALLAAVAAYRANPTPDLMAAARAAKMKWSETFRAERTAVRTAGGGWGGGFGRRRRHRRHGWHGGRMGAAGWGSRGPVSASAAPISTSFPSQSSPPMQLPIAGGVVPAVPAAAPPIFSSSPLAGLGNIVTDILNSVGIRDPIKVYEPELANNLPAVFAKYRDQVARYSTEVRGLRSDREVSRLLGELGRPVRLVEEIAPAFAGGGTVGKRERDKLAELVQLIRDFRTEFGKAKKAVGWAPPGAEAEEAPVVVAPAAAAPASSGPPWGLILLGIAIAAVASNR